MTRRLLLAGFLALAAGMALPPGPVRGQTGPEAAAAAFAEAWEAGDLEGLRAVLASERIRLTLPGDRRALVDPDEAVAVLRDLHQRHHTVASAVRRVSRTDGSSRRGWAEVTWIARPGGGDQEAVHTVFVGLLREDGAWRVDEIRILS